jgi:hypothetical protein
MLSELLLILSSMDGSEKKNQLEVLGSSLTINFLKR